MAVIGHKHRDDYVSILTIYNADGTNVGFYFCREVDNKYNYASIYVYVEDDQMLYTGGQKSVYGFALFDHLLIILCRPTSPNVTVKLYELNGIDSKTEVKLNNREKDGFNWTYNPMKGFILSNAIKQPFGRTKGPILHNKTNLTTDYVCTFSRGQTVQVPVAFIWQKMPTYSNRPLLGPWHDKQHHKEGENLKLACEVDYMPYGLTPIFNWKFNTTELKNDEKYTISNSDPIANQDPFSNLIIHNISMHRDLGIYTCQVYDGFDNSEESFYLHILSSTGEGSFLNLKVKNDKFSESCIEPCTSIIWNVDMESFPPATIIWFNNRNQEIFDDGKYKVKNTDGGSTLEIYNVTLDDRGTFTIAANNTYKSEKRNIFLNVEGKPTVKIFSDIFHLRNEEEKIECKITGYPKSQIYWMFKFCIECDNHVPIKSKESADGLTTFISTAVMNNNQTGYIQCYATNIHGNNSETLHYIVKDPEVLRVVTSNMDDLEHELTYHDTHNFTCYYEGFPTPHITWYKDNKRIYEDNRIKFDDNNQTLIFTWTEPSDVGKYGCRVENRLNFVERKASIVFTNKIDTDTLYIIVSVLALLSLIFVGLIVKMCRDRKHKRALEFTSLLNFEKGVVESINPDLAIYNQTDFLPYDREMWEISKQHIKLGQKLGAGEFGLVMKGVVERYNRRTKYYEAPFTVAVKMINNIANDIHLKALISELKIMAHLGTHLNIVNLIGAWTKHIVKRELYVIVEYCRLGNLHEYLLRHRENFINQIDSDAAKIDYEVGADILKSQKKFPKNKMEEQNNPNYNNPLQMPDDTWVIVFPTECHGNKSLTSKKIDCECNFRDDDDDKETSKSICTKNLLIWAYQVSRGMEYLVSRKILHGDLAARNILLADNNVVKISDFGLSKRLYRDYYKKKGNGPPLPIKWMSVEAIRDQIFSTASDVWSFGIVLWEFFSLAETPYPGIEANEKFFKKLANGYRMDCPAYATNEIYTMMLNCWQSKPLDRPSFEQLSENIGQMLEESVKKHYIDLNAPNVKINTERFQNEEDDYFKMINPPDFYSLSSPHYVNHITHDLNNTASNCMPMKSDHIVTSRENNCNILTLTNEEVIPLEAPKISARVGARLDVQHTVNTDEFYESHL